MRILTCFLPPSEGKASVAGFDVLEQPMEVKRRIGYLPETPPLYPDMEVAEYLDFVGKLKGLRGNDLAKRITEVSERTQRRRRPRQADRQAFQGLPAARRPGPGAASTIRMC